MFELPLEVFDCVVAGIVIFTLIHGAIRGMAWQLASIASLVVSAVVAMRFSGVFAPAFGSQAPWNRFLAIFVLFLGTSLAIWLLFRAVSGFINRLQLKDFDRQMGAIFGLVKGLLICLALTFFGVTLAEGSRALVLRSWSGNFLARVIWSVVPALPEEVRTAMGEYLERFEKGIKRPVEPTDSVSLRDSPVGKNSAVGDRISAAKFPAAHGRLGPWDRPATKSQLRDACAG